MNVVLKEQEVKEEVKIKEQQDYVDDFDGFGDDEEIDFWGTKKPKGQEKTIKKVAPEPEYDDFGEDDDTFWNKSDGVITNGVPDVNGIIDVDIDCDWENEERISIKKPESKTEQVKKEEVNVVKEKQVAKPCEVKENIKDIDSLTDVELINELNVYRFNNGISQLMLAKELNLSITTVNNWFCKRFKPSMLHSFKIKKFLKEKLKQEKVK